MLSLFTDSTTISLIVLCAVTSTTTKPLVPKFEHYLSSIYLSTIYLSIYTYLSINSFQRRINERLAILGVFYDI